MIDEEVLWRHAERYARLRKLMLKRDLRLGNGTDGTVWESSSNSAVKAVQLEKNYVAERESYLRLRDAGVVKIRGFAVPALIDTTTSCV